MDLTLKAGWYPGLAKVVNQVADRGFSGRFTEGAGVRVAPGREGKEEVRGWCARFTTPPPHDPAADY